MNPKRILTPAELATVCDMQDRGIGLTRIARHLRCGRAVLERELDAICHVPKRARRGGRFPADGKDPFSNAAIGTLPPEHPLHAVDQAILRARTQRQPPLTGWRQSSLADL